jgi:hypothetical protein
LLPTCVKRAEDAPALLALVEALRSASAAP